MSCYSGIAYPEFVATWSQVHVALEPQSLLLVSEVRETCGVCALNYEVCINSG